MTKEEEKIYNANISLKNGSGEFGDLEMVKKSLKNGADINDRTVFGGGETPLLLSIKYCNREITEYLIEKGADLNLKDYRYGDTPLISALQKEDFITAKYLIEKGADVNAKNKKGETALMETTSCLCNRDDAEDLEDRFEIVKILIKHGANINAKDNDGKTVFHCKYCVNEKIKSFLKSKMQIKPKTKAKAKTKQKSNDFSMGM